MSTKNSNSSNKIVLDKRKSQFKNYSFSEDNFCIVNILVEENEYKDTKKRYFYISYEYEYGENSNKSANPFYGNKEMLENHSDGEIIFKNELSEKLVDFLLMNDEELSERIGFGSTFNYKSSIMRMITHIWD